MPSWVRYSIAAYIGLSLAGALLGRPASSTARMNEPRAEHSRPDARGDGIMDNGNGYGDGIGGIRCRHEEVTG